MTNCVAVLMMSQKFHHLWLLISISFLFLLPLHHAVPLSVSQNLYNEFIDSLINNCEMPKEIFLPFAELKDPSHFDYLTGPLIQCQTPEAVKVDEEAHLLCKETFDIFREIACSKPNTSIPEVKPTLNLTNVCGEFASLKNVLTKKDNYLSGRLVDNVVCMLLCSVKFKTLCQTLLWSYDVKNQLKKLTEKTVVEDKAVEHVPESAAKDTENNLKDVPQEPVLDKGNDAPEKEVDVNYENENTDGKKDLKSNSLDKNSLDNNNNLVAENPVAIIPNNSTIAEKLKSVNASIKDAGLSALFQSRILLPKNNSVTNQVAPEVDNPNMKNEAHDKTVLPGHNEPKKLEPDSKEPVKVTAAIPLESKASNVSEGLVINKSGTVDNEGTEVEPLPGKPEENELHAGNLDEENLKDTGMENGLSLPESGNSGKDTVKPKETVADVPEKVTVAESLKSESTTTQVAFDKNVEDPEDRDADQYYNDTENEDYPKSEYENTLNELKARKPSVKSSVVSEVVNPNDDMQSNYDLLLSRNNFGRGQDTPMISSFPEQEDSHFFFYFLSIVLILMAGYLLVHNKQKIIALIVEGRHERRRRSHGAAYKKLDAK